MKNNLGSRSTSDIIDSLKFRIERIKLDRARHSDDSEFMRRCTKLISETDKAIEELKTQEMKKEIYFPKGAKSINFDLEKGIATAIYEEEKPAFKVGEWYILNNSFVSLYMGEYNNVGFDLTLGCKFRSNIFMTVPEDWKPADMQEVKKLLIKEAEKRGYKKGVKIKTTLGLERTIKDKLFISPDTQMHLSSNSIEDGRNYASIFNFKTGKWAEIVKKPIYENSFGVVYHEGDDIMANSGECMVLLKYELFEQLGIEQTNENINILASAYR